MSIKTFHTAEGDVSTIASYRIFRLEFNRLHKLYDNSIYSYQIGREYIYGQINAGLIERNQEIKFTSYESRDMRIGMAQSSAHNLRVQYPRYLRELIFTRFISALEIFLVDALKEAFLIKKDLLKVDASDVMKISEAEFLSYASLEEALEVYIERKCRSLHGQGYLEIKKFYSKNLAIDFANSGIDLNKMDLYHDQRHLLVHEIGKTDKQYRHKYNTVAKTITVKEEYLYETSKAIADLARYINDQLIALIIQD